MHSIAQEHEFTGPGVDRVGRHIELMPLDRLTPYKGNARTHSKKQIRQIAESIKRFGFNNPILIDEAGEILAGHGRVAAAKLLGLAGAPALRLSHLSPAEKRAYVIADNRLAEKAGWDREILAIELQGLIDLDFEVELTGFELGEIDLTLADADDARQDRAAPEDQVPQPKPDKAVSRLGDLWELGQHRLLCGDARYQQGYALLLGGERADFVFADPSLDGTLTGEARTDLLHTVFRHLAAHSKDGSLHAICAHWRSIGEMLAAGNKIYAELKDLCVWAKSQSVFGEFYPNQHELVLLWKAGDGPLLAKRSRAQQASRRSNLWQYPNLAARDERTDRHSSRQPVALVADAIKDCSQRAGIVLDPFLGLGTTLIAAERCGRRARGIEKDRLFVDLAIRRWQDDTGKAAILRATGQTFEGIEEERCQSGETACAVSHAQPVATGEARS